MKKLLCVFLGLIVCLSFVACDNSESINSLNSQVEQLQKEKDKLANENSSLNNQLDLAIAERDALKSEKEEKEQAVTVSADDVTIVVVDKVNTPKDTDNWLFSSYSTFHISIKNNTDKAIKGVQGILDTQDMFGVSIYKANCDLTGIEIQPGETIINKAMSLEINEFMDDHTKLYNTDFKDLKFNYEVKTIMFTDGTTKTK